MKKFVAFSLCFMTSTMLSARASRVFFTNVQFDGRDCQESKGVYKTDKADFQVKIEARDDKKATLGFYILTRSEPDFKIVLEADLEVDPLTFKPQGEAQAYKPAMTLSGYIARLNDMQIPGFRRFIWNKNGDQTLTKDKSGPAVIFELRNTLKFYESKSVHDTKAHTTKVFIEYGLEGDEVKGQFLVHEFQHEPVRTPVQDYLWIDSYKAIKGLVSVVFNTLPDEQKRTWGEAYTFVPCETYAELHDGFVHEVLLNRDSVVVPASGIYFRKEKGSPLESHFVNEAGGKYYMTRLRKVSAQAYQAENRGAEGYVFTLLEGQNPELHILDRTNYPLRIDSNANIVPPFEYGYYRCESMSWESNTVNQTFDSYPNSQTVSYKSRQQSAFSEADLTETILNSSTNIADLTECLRHLNMANKGVLKPKVIIRLAGKGGTEVMLASDRLLPIIEACMDSHGSIDNTEFGQLILTDPTLQKFLMPHITSFPKMHVDADILHFNTVKVSNPLIDWLWTSRFQFKTLKNVNAEKVEISCLGDNNETLTKLSELRSIKPTSLKFTFENLKSEDREILLSIIRDNPRLTELALHGPVDMLGTEVFKVIADHASIKTFTYAPCNNNDIYQALSDNQVNDLFAKAKHFVPITLDLTSSSYDRVKLENIARFLTNNKDTVRELKLGNNCPANISDAIKTLTALKKLDASSPRLCDDEITRLSLALSDIKTLTEIVISLPRWSLFNGYIQVHCNLAKIPNLDKLTLKCADWGTWHKEQIEGYAKYRKKKFSISVE